MPATDLAHPDLDRPLSVEEYKRIQEFPDDWKIAGNIRQQYKQIGNAIPVSLGYAIGKLILKHYLKQKIKVISGFKYSRYLNTNDQNWVEDNKKQLNLRF
jgi:DNA (cytosine-5)-methyltransferase 1